MTAERLRSADRGSWARRRMRRDATMEECELRFSTVIGRICDRSSGRRTTRAARSMATPPPARFWLPPMTVVIAGHLQLVTAGEGTAELKSMAVVESRRGGGVGRALVEAALQWCRDRGVRRLAVATAAADTGNLRFYQRQGFRMLRIERDAFGPDTGYAEEIIIDGIPLRDRVWLDQDV